MGSLTGQMRLWGGREGDGKGPGLGSQRPKAHLHPTGRWHDLSKLCALCQASVFPLAKWS